jgi:predicted dehydrogenase
MSQQPRTLRVGFIGAGLIATFHSKMIKRSDVDVVRSGVYDIDAARAVEFARASGHTVALSEDDVFDSCDAVYICTWTSEHPRLVEAAASRGLAIFCEKPLASTAAKARAMAHAVNAAGVTNQVGLILRRSPAYVWARHLISEPSAGPVMTVVFRDDQFIPVQGHYGSTWRADKHRAGAGTLIEHSIHDVDMLRFLVGDITDVSARSANHHGHDGIEDAFTATFSFANGAVGTLASVWHDNLARPSLRRVEIFCARRYIHLDGDDWTGPVSWTDADGSDHCIEGAELDAAVERAGLIEGHANPDAAFLLAAASREQSWPDFTTAVGAHDIVDAMYRSAASGSSVAIGP